jgi:hypothetical protein
MDGDFLYLSGQLLHLVAILFSSRGHKQGQQIRPARPPLSGVDCKVRLSSMTDRRGLCFASLCQA